MDCEQYNTIYSIYKHTYQISTVQLFQFLDSVELEYRIQSPETDMHLYTLIL